MRKKEEVEEEGRRSICLNVAESRSWSTTCGRSEDANNGEAPSVEALAPLIDAQENKNRERKVFMVVQGLFVLLICWHIAQNLNHLNDSIEPVFNYLNFSSFFPSFQPLDMHIHLLECLESEVCRENVDHGSFRRHSAISRVRHLGIIHV